MTVTEALIDLYRSYGCAEYLPSFDFRQRLQQRLGPACAQFHGLRRFLHKISGTRMREMYGPSFNWEQVANIDDVSEMTSEEVAEYRRRKAQLRGLIERLGLWP